MNITTERIDDFPLLLEIMQRLGLPGILDNHLHRHGLQQGSSWGWIGTIWLAHILTQSNPRKQPVQVWVRQAQATIERITGMKVKELDFTNDRLTLLLRRLSKPETRQSIETDLGRSIMRVYELKPERVRLDATTVSGYHASGEDTLFQYGHSKDDPSLALVKVMMATLDPLGLPLATQVVAGNTADDPLYVPAVDRVLQIIDGAGLLFVGDCKMSALSIRAHIHQRGQHYLCPLAQTGKTGQEMMGWIEAANDGQHKAVRFLTLIEFVVRRKLKQNQEKLVGLIENNPKKGIDNPTTERLLKMFDNITLTIVQMPGQNIRHLPALTVVHV